MMRRRFFLFAPLALVGFAVFVALGGLIVRSLWNALLPSLFHWPALTFWQALGLLVLSRVLFGNFGMHGAGRRHRMSPEERERFHQRFGRHFGFGRPEPEDGAATPAS
jgi:hypothetical protein